MTGRHRDGAAAAEDGTITLLTIGLVAVLVLLVVTVVDVSAVYLDHRDLAGECDSAALAASQATDPAALYAQGVGARLPVTDSSVSVAAGAVARTVGAGTRTVTAVDSITGDVFVTCHRVVRLPVGAVIGLPTITLDAGSSAQSPVR